MTDEYKAYLESKRSESSDHKEIEHAEIPHWKPPKKQSEEDHLEHHGVKGQKWGIRRYQNEDGTRINAEPRKKKEPEFKSKTLQYKKSAQNLTDEELRQRNNRMQLELQYERNRRELQAMRPKTKAEKRKELLKTIFVDSAKAAAADVVKSFYSYEAKKLITIASKGKVALDKEAAKSFRETIGDSVEAARKAKTKTVQESAPQQQSPSRSESKPKSEAKQEPKGDKYDNIADRYYNTRLDQKATEKLTNRLKNDKDLESRIDKAANREVEDALKLLKKKRKS